MAFYIKNKEGQILISGGSLEIGDGLKVEEGVLKADVDNELKTDSSNPVENQVVTQRINEIDLVTSAALNDLNNNKADKDNFKTINGESIIGSGNIEIESGGGGTIDNIEVNGIEGIVENKVASVDITGLDVPVGEGFTQSTETNDNLQILETDNVSEALGKLQKVWKDDEEVMTRAFFAIKESTGFNDNLEYQTVDDSSNFLYDVTDLQQADTKLAGAITDLQTFIVNNTFTINVNNTSYRVLKPQGSSQTSVSINTPQAISLINNVTALYPPSITVSQTYYDLSSVLSLANLPNITLGMEPGTCYTWKESENTWVMYQYIGTNNTAENWRDSNNWVKRW